MTYKLNIAEIFNRLSRVHERYRQSSRSLIMKVFLRPQLSNSECLRVNKNIGNTLSCYSQVYSYANTNRRTRVLQVQVISLDGICI